MGATEFVILDNQPAMIRKAILHSASLAHASIIHTRSWCANSNISKVRLIGKLDTANQKIALLEEQLRIISARFSRIPPHNRPFYTPAEPRRDNPQLFF